MACKPGFFGASCSSPCPLGFYGRNCGGVCYPNCSEEKCDLINGCRQSTETIIQPATSVKDVLLVTEDQLVLSAFNSNYLVYGLGGVICLILIAILIQQCKKSKSSQRTAVKNKSHRSYESQFHAQEGDQRSYETPSESEKTVQVYKPPEAEYAEINEELQVHFPCSSKISIVFEKAKKNCEKMSLAQGNINLPINDIVFEQSSEQPVLYANSTGSIVSQSNIYNNIEDHNAYTNAI